MVLLSQNGGTSLGKCARNSLGMSGSFYCDQRYNTDVTRHNTDIRPWILENMDKEIA
jgi:hypothetical protein